MQLPGFPTRERLPPAALRFLLVLLDPSQHVRKLFPGQEPAHFHTPQGRVVTGARFHGDQVIGSNAQEPPLSGDLRALLWKISHWVG